MGTYPSRMWSVGSMRYMRQDALVKWPVNPVLGVEPTLHAASGRILRRQAHRQRLRSAAARTHLLCGAIT